MTHLRTVLAIVHKDVLEILFNKATMSMLLTPILIDIIFAALSGLVGRQLAKLLIYNPQHSASSRWSASHCPGPRSRLPAFRMRSPPP